MTVWHDTIAAFGDVDVVISTVVVTACMDVVLRPSAVCQWCCCNKMTHGGHHCSLNVCNRGWGLSGTGIRLILAHITCAAGHVNIESFACLTMSNLPAKFHSCRLIPSGCSFLCSHSLMMSVSTFRNSELRLVLATWVPYMD